MQLTAKLVQKLPLQTGTGKNGEWRKQDIIVETDGQYPKKVCISIWGDKINDAILQPGNVLTIDFDVESREYNGKWYTDVKAWKVEVSGGSGSGKGATSTSSVDDEAYNGSDAVVVVDDDLPF